MFSDFNIGFVELIFVIFGFLKRKRYKLGGKKQWINKRRNKKRKMKILGIIPILTFVAKSILPKLIKENVNLGL